MIDQTCDLDHAMKAQAIAAYAAVDVSLNPSLAKQSCK